MATTTNFGWETPDDTDLVKDGAAAIRTLGQSIDTSMADLEGGTTGQVLSKASNADMDFTWVTTDDANAIQNAIVDAKGDLIAATAADTPARLAVGTNGQVLTADSTQATGLIWAAPATGGMTSLATGSFTGASVSITSISGSYRSLYLVIANWRPASANASLRGTFNSDTNTRYANEVFASNAFTYSEASFRVTQGQSATVSDGLWIMEIPEYATTTTWKMSKVNGGGNNNATTTTNNTVMWNNFYNQTGAISSIQLFPSSGNHTAGSYTLYGVK